MANTTLRKITVNGKEYDFVCTWRKNRSGFVHECELQNNGRWLADTKAQYYNRTWETYSYQSVMRNCVSILKARREAEIKSNFMTENHYGRLTENRKVELEKLYKADSELAELELLDADVKDGHLKYNFW